MIDTSYWLEKFLQNYRFKHVKKYLIGDVLDFGGNKGELKKLVTGEYCVVNYDYSHIKNKKFDTIVMLAVLEHIEPSEVVDMINGFRKNNLKYGGKIVFTTPSKIAKPVLEFLAFIRLLDKENIREHKKYWGKKEIYELAGKTNMTVKIYFLFQLIFNQFFVFDANPN